MPTREYYDERIGEFFTVDGKTIRLEHSLLSISKWESKWKRSFLSDGPKNPVEVADYIQCMCLDHDVDPRVFRGLSRENQELVQAYIQDPMTATTFSKVGSKRSNRRRVVTSEEIYYSMLSFGIPLECQKWHFNRLMTLIRVFQEKETPSKRMSRSDIMRRNTELNAKRRSMMGSRG